MITLGFFGGYSEGSDFSWNGSNAVGLNPFVSSAFTDLQNAINSALSQAGSSNVISPDGVIGPDTYGAYAEVVGVPQYGSAEDLAANADAAKNQIQGQSGSYIHKMSYVPGSAIIGVSAQTPSGGSTNNPASGSSSGGFLNTLSNWFSSGGGATPTTTKPGATPRPVTQSGLIPASIAGGIGGFSWGTILIASALGYGAYWAFFKKKESK